MNLAEKQCCKGFPVKGKPFFMSFSSHFPHQQIPRKSCAQLWIKPLKKDPFLAFFPPQKKYLRHPENRAV